MVSTSISNVRNATRLWQKGGGHHLPLHPCTHFPLYNPKAARCNVLYRLTGYYPLPGHSAQSRNPVEKSRKVINREPSVHKTLRDEG
jgi:hypothetical protein